MSWQAVLCPGQDHDRRAISVQLDTVAGGQSRILADIRTRRSAVLTSGDLLSSQADNAGSIPVTRSSVKAQVGDGAPGPIRSLSPAPPVVGDHGIGQCQRRSGSRRLRLGASIGRRFLVTGAGCRRGRLRAAVMGCLCMPPGNSQGVVAG